MNNLTDSDIAAWFDQKRAANADLKSLHVGFSSDYHARFVATNTDYSCPGTRNFFADTLDAAIAKLRAGTPSPAVVAAEKRAAAEKLIAEAVAIEESANGPEPEDPRAGLAGNIAEDEDRHPERERDEPDYDALRPLTAMENYQRNDEHRVP